MAYVFPRYFLAINLNRLPQNLHTSLVWGQALKHTFEIFFNSIFGKYFGVFDLDSG